MKLITGKVGGILIETQDIILGDCVVSMDSDSLIFRPDGATKAQLKDNITFIPPQTASTVSTNPYDFTVGDLSAPYRYLEIRTTGHIYVDGVVDADGQGFVGGAAGADGSVFSNSGRGGYLADGKAGDPLNEKTFQEAINLGYSQERHRNAVFPGSGGSGGAKNVATVPSSHSTSGNSSGGSAAGGSGGGFVRLIADNGITFRNRGKIQCRGVLDGQNGGDGSFRYGNATCKQIGCKGTFVNDYGLPWAPSAEDEAGWKPGYNAVAGRSLGNSRGGSPAACCSLFQFGSRSWERCGKSDRDGINKDYLYYPEGGCVYGKNGYGGAGGGVLLRSYGPISFRKGDIDLRGYNGPSHGGTLKIFHSGIVPSWIYEVGDTTKAKASSDLKQYVGGFYNENLYSGYCADFDTFRVQSLTSVAASYPAGEEKFNLHFEEGKAFVPNGLKVSHGGFEIYRYIDISGSEYFGAETPPPPSNANWTLVATQPYMSTAFLGPQGINNPRNGQVAADSLKRLWTYNAGDENFAPGWYLDETYARPRGLYGTFDFSDDRIYFYLRQVKGQTYNASLQTVQDILFAKKAIWYRIVPVFLVGGVKLSPDCGDNLTIHPEITRPQMDLSIYAEKSTPYEYSPPSIDGRIPNSNFERYDKYYDNKRYSYSNAVRGYDDLLVRLATPSYWGSFQFTQWTVDWDSAHTSSEIFTTMSVSANTPRIPEVSVNRYWTYEEPTQLGRFMFRPSPYDPSGIKQLTVVGQFNRNCYNHAEPTTLTRTATAKIYEREPTPVFHLSAFDNPNGPRAGDSRPTGDNKVNKYFTFPLDQNAFYFGRIVSGYSDGITVNFFDESVARTYPISSWNINYDTASGASNSGHLGVLSYGETFADSQKLRPNYDVLAYNLTVIPTTSYNSAGIYYPTLTIQASTSNTSYDLSAINRVYVYPLPPSALFTSTASSNAETVSAFVPIYFKATDESLSNSSYPISVWNWLIYDNFDRTFLDSVSTFFVSGNVLEHNWRWHTDNFELSNRTVDETLTNLCLNVQTSAFARWGRTDSDAVDSLFLGDSPIFSESTVCKHLYLYERPPVSDLTAIDAVTYVSSFTDDDPDYEERSAFIGNHYVSGYCPYLAITFQENCTPKSYPISGYFWNFGDYYNEDTNLYAVELPLNSETSGWTVFPEDHGADGSENYPEWTTEATDHLTDHVFTLPGIYLVTLNAKASSTGTTRSSVLSVYLEEKLPTCGFWGSLDKINWTQSETLSGEAPLTVYFTPSSVISGSFPIGRLIWDFGDGTEPLVVDRYIDNYTNQPWGSDPRGFNGGIVEHVYERQFVASPSSFNVSLSVVSEYSNSVVSCSGLVVGPLKLPSFSLNGDEMHLIKNRSLELKPENLLILQRESDKSVYNITLSAH